MCSDCDCGGACACRELRETDERRMHASDVSPDCSSGACEEQAAGARIARKCTIQRSRSAESVVKAVWSSEQRCPLADATPGWSSGGMEEGKAAHAPESTWRETHTHTLRAWLEKLRKPAETKRVGDRTSTATQTSDAGGLEAEAEKGLRSVGVQCELDDRRLRLSRSSAPGADRRPDGHMAPTQSSQRRAAGKHLRISLTGSSALQEKGAQRLADYRLRRHEQLEQCWHASGPDNCNPTPLQPARRPCSAGGNLAPVNAPAPGTASAPVSSHGGIPRPLPVIRFDNPAYGSETPRWHESMDTVPPPPTPPLFAQAMGCAERPMPLAPLLSTMMASMLGSQPNTPRPKPIPEEMLMSRGADMGCKDMPAAGTMQPSTPCAAAPVPASSLERADSNDSVQKACQLLGSEDDALDWHDSGASADESNKSLRAASVDASTVAPGPGSLCGAAGEGGKGGGPGLPTPRGEKWAIGVPNMDDAEHAMESILLQQMAGLMQERHNWGVEKQQLQKEIEQLRELVGFLAEHVEGEEAEDVEEGEDEEGEEDAVHLGPHPAGTGHAVAEVMTG